MLLCCIAVALYSSTAKAITQPRELQHRQLLHLQLKRYYHADGYIKSIGAVAYRTIYSSNDTIRHKWVNRLHRLVKVRADALLKIDDLRHPQVVLGTPPHLAALTCIHGYEGSWSANTGNGYYGGLQMDLGFQETYAEALSQRFKGFPNLLKMKGTADHWTPLEQLWVAEMAIESRGFYPWPNTARYCGLI